MSNDNPTVPYPDFFAGTEQQPAPQRRRRWPWILGIVLVLIVVLVGIAEVVAKNVVESTVRDGAIEYLELPTDQQIDVSTDGFVLPQLIAGRLNTLHASSDDITIEGFSGAVDVTATDIELRGGNIGGAMAILHVDGDQFTSLLSGLNIPFDNVKLEAPYATISGSIDVLGFPLPLALTIEPAAEDGQVLITPESVKVGGFELDAAGVANLGKLSEQLTKTHKVCIADQLPAAVTLTGLRIEGDLAVLDLAVEGALLEGEALAQKGVCP